MLILDKQKMHNEEEEVEGGGGGGGGEGGFTSSYRLSGKL